MSANSFSGSTSLQTAADVEDALRSHEVPTRLLHEIWMRREPLGIDCPPKTSVRQIAWLQGNFRLARAFTAAALKNEEYLLVYDAAPEILRMCDAANDPSGLTLVRVSMDYAAALTRLGSTLAARRVLEPCVEPGFQPRLDSDLKADILIQIGNILREESHFAATRAERFLKAEEALGFYRRALEIEPKRLETIFLVAAASLIIGEKGSALWNQARSLAAEILALVLATERKEGPKISTVWPRAIAHTILGDPDAAASAYGTLATLEDVTTSHLAEARYRAQSLAEAIGKDRKHFHAAFPPLQLVVFAGHQPDADGTPPRLQRFPASAFDAMRAALNEKLNALGARAGLVSACAGADLLFAEALRARKGDLHVVLPWAQNDFRANRVAPFDGAGPSPLWTPLFDRTIEAAATVRELGQMYEPGSDVTWQYMTEVTAGIALNTARALRLDVQPMAIWDGLPGRGVGGTESFVEFWRQQLRTEPIILDLPPASGASSARPHPVSVGRCEESTMKHQVKSVLFADIVGYSKLNERVIPEFVSYFLERVSRLVASSKNAPLSVNTWGDAIYAVFDFAHQAGNFALELAEMIHQREAEWTQKGLFWEDRPCEGSAEGTKRPLNVRIGLHTGPVFIHYDPIVRRLGYTGAHVNRAARIEPVTQPGEVYASEEFAALAELDAEIEKKKNGANGSGRPIGFYCEYAGTMPLAKNFPGRHRIYRVLPKKAFALEELARAAHELYCLESKARGETSETNPSIRLWNDLPEELRDANRSQVADIPNKLRVLGYELAPAHGTSPSEITMTDAQVEELSVREHLRWMNDWLRRGWTRGPRKDPSQKHHPLLVPWDELTPEEKEKDRDAVRNVPKFVEKAGFKVRKIQASSSQSKAAVTK